MVTATPSTLHAAQSLGGLERPAGSGGFSAAPQIARTGKRVRVLEDEALIALTLTDTMREFGCVIIGQTSTPAAALDLVARQAPDIAMLDVNLAGASSAPVAKALRAAGVLRRFGLIAK